MIFMDWKKRYGIPTPYVANTFAYILEGQSNAQGAESTANIQPDLVGAQNGCRIYTPSSGTWPTLQAGVNNQPNAMGNAFFGLEMRLMKNLQAFYGANQYMYKYAISGTQLAFSNNATQDWSPQSVGELYALSNANYTAGFAALPERVVLRAYLWNQWEQDGTNTTLSLAYGTNLKNYIAAKRDFYGNSRLPFIIFRASNSSNSANLGLIQYHQDKVCRYTYNNGVFTDTGMSTVDKVDNTYLIYTNSATLQPDLTHHTAAGYNTIALAAVDVITNYLV